jgi:hypothetical protein
MTISLFRQTPQIRRERTSIHNALLKPSRCPRMQRTNDKRTVPMPAFNDTAEPQEKAKAAELLLVWKPGHAIILLL